MRRPRKGWRLPPVLAMLLGLLLALAPLLATAQPGVGGQELQVFVREGCPHCAAAKAFLPELRRQRPEIRVRLRPLESDPAAIDDLLRYSRQVGIGPPGVPTFVLEGQVLVGFDSAEGPARNCSL
jgi:glutaredoxin